MHSLNRRSVLRSISAATLAVPTSAILTDRAMAVSAASSVSIDQLIFAQRQQEETWAFFRSFYSDKDNVDVPKFLSHFVKSGLDQYQDATLGLVIAGYDVIAANFTGFLNAVASALGKGQFSKVFRVVGDMRFGAVVEYVDLKNTFYATNGITVQTVFDLDNGLIARDTDYWDSRELGMSDIVGPAATTGVAVPLGAVHAGGVPRTAASPVPPGPMQLAIGPTGRPSASSEMVSFVKMFHEALRQGRPEEVAEFFTEDALYVNPLIHQGAVGYGNFDQSIQIRGRQLIARLLQAASQLLPDCKDSKLTHIVGGPAGGGFEWKAGGIYNYTGLDRTGLVGCTALDLFGNRIQRMSVKFDTFQMSAKQYDNIRSALLQAGVVDQRQT
jgi:hypothetical protein